MAIFKNGHKIESLFYKGQKIGSLWYHGKKIYSSYLPAGTVLLAINDRATKVYSIDKLDKVKNGITITFLGVMAISSEDGHSYDTNRDDASGLEDSIQIPKSKFNTGGIKIATGNTGTLDSQPYAGHPSVAYVEVKDNNVIFSGGDGQNSTQILDSFDSNSVAINYYVKIGTISAY